MNKTQLHILLMFFYVAIVIYLLTSFVTLSFNIFDWTFESRLLLAIGTIFTSVITIPMVLISGTENNKTLPGHRKPPPPPKAFGA